ncbi:MAG: glycosyltransferase family 1 protein [bacterium]
MNIAINALQLPKEKTGVGQYLAGLLPALLDHAADHHFTTYAHAFNHDNFRILRRNHSLKCWGPAIPSVGLRRLVEWARFPATLRKDHIDLLFGVSNFLPLWRVCHYVVCIHDLSYLVQPERVTRLRGAYWQRWTNRTVAVADMIVTDSQYSKRDILRYFDYPEEDVRVVYPGIAARFKPAADRMGVRAVLERYGVPQDYLLFVGTLEPGKNVHRLVEAFAQVRRAGFRDLWLVLVGKKGWKFDEVYRALERQKVRDWVKFPGYVPDDDLPAFYQGARLFCFPSLNEGFGLPLAEAMACGTPCLTSNVSSLPEIAGDAAAQVDPYDSEAMAEAMIGLLRDEERMEMLRAKGPGRVAEFSWERTARGLFEVFKEVVARPPRVGERGRRRASPLRWRD